MKRKGSPKITHLSGYVGAFLLIVTLVALGYQPPQRIDNGVANASPVANAVPAQDAVTPSVDEIVATSVAGGIAERANLPIAPNVAELSVSLAVKNELAQNDETTITKPQIVQPTSSREIRTYTTKAGDTAQAVAGQFGISAVTLKWVNNLTSDALDVGKQLTIPPVDGIIYTVKDGDTAETLAARYGIDKDQIVAYNDLELGGLTKDKKIILPGAILPENERPGYVAPRTAVASYSSYSSAARSNLTASVGNRYAYGYCTWYAYNRRAQLGRPIGSFWGNANAWAGSAMSAGFGVDNQPSAGDIFQTGAGGWGHVGIIESVDWAAGTVTYSDMNGLAGWGRVGSETITIGDAQARWQFIH